MDVSIDIPRVLLAQIEDEVEASRAASVSDWVVRAVEKRFENDQLWRKTVEEALDEGGPLTDEEQAWVDDVVAKAMRPG